MKILSFHNSLEASAALYINGKIVAAISEEAYITATLAMIFISIELLASFYLPKEHVHFKPIKSDVHEDCKD